MPILIGPTPPTIIVFLAGRPTAHMVPTVSTKPLLLRSPSSGMQQSTCSCRPRWRLAASVSPLTRWSRDAQRVAPGTLNVVISAMIRRKSSSVVLVSGITAPPRAVAQGDLPPAHRSRPATPARTSGRRTVTRARLGRGHPVTVPSRGDGAALHFREELTSIGERPIRAVDRLRLR